MKAELLFTGCCEQMVQTYISDISEPQRTHFKRVQISPVLCHIYFSSLLDEVSCRLIIDGLSFFQDQKKKILFQCHMVIEKLEPNSEHKKKENVGEKIQSSGSQCPFCFNPRRLLGRRQISAGEVKWLTVRDTQNKLTQSVLSLFFSLSLSFLHASLSFHPNLLLSFPLSFGLWWSHAATPSAVLPTHTQSTALVWFGSTETQSVNFELQSLKYKKVLQQNTAIFLRNVRKIGKKENRVKTQTFEEKK